MATQPIDPPPREDDASSPSGGWSEKTKIHRKPFPGPAGAAEILRIALTREAYADLTAHAKESLHAEICGVLVGDLCEDGNGPFVSVEAIIRGGAAREESTHVTFTQETWVQIHKEKDSRHAKRQIVGWYHTHPGFGVEFSEMDRFVQRNFFAGTGQIAFVTDPLGGQEAILVNSADGIVPVSRFWVDGRERRCQGALAAGAAPAPGTIPPSVQKAIESVEERIGQLMQMIDAQSASMHRFLLVVGMVAAMGMLAFVGYSIYSVYAHENRPPELESFVPVPVQIGDKSVLLGVGIVKWDVPPSLNSAMLQLERERQAAEKAAAATQPGAGAGASAGPSSTTQPGG